MRCEPSTGIFLSVVTDGVLSLQQVCAPFLAAARSIRRFCSSSSALCFAMRSVGGVGMGRASGTETDATFFLGLVYEAPTILRLHHHGIDSSSGSCGKSGSGSEILLM